MILRRPPEHRNHGGGAVFARQGTQRARKAIAARTSARTVNEGELVDTPCQTYLWEVP